MHRTAWAGVLAHNGGPEASGSQGLCPPECAWEEERAGVSLPSRGPLVLDVRTANKGGIFKARLLFGEGFKILGKCLDMLGNASCF